MVFIVGLGAGYALALYLHSPAPEPRPEEQAAFITRPETVATATPTPSPLPELNPAPIQVLPVERLQELAAARQWEQIAVLGWQWLRKDPGAKALLAPYLEQAYVGLVRAALDQGDVAGARHLLSEADAGLEPSAPRQLLAAEMYQIQRDFRGALNSLHQSVALDPLLVEAIYPQIRQLVAAEAGRGTASPDERIRLLQEEIIADPGYAPYYEILGRLYYEQGVYRQALTQLGYALQLEPDLSPRLVPLIASAQRRLASPELVEVPLDIRGQSLYVRVRLNDLAQEVRFILDTGASFTAISEELARRLGLADLEGLPTVELSTAKGRIRVPLITLRSVDLQGARVENVAVVILPELEGGDGLLGLSFLSRFNVDISHSEQKLLLSRRH
jgi:clan AA aspartic protease (TIGR02281 family)